MLHVKDYHQEQVTSHNSLITNLQHTKWNKICSEHYVHPRNTGTKMIADRDTCWPLVSHVEYAPRNLLRVDKTGQTDRQTDRRMPDRSGPILRKI